MGELTRYEDKKPLPEKLSDSAGKYAQASISSNTQRAYRFAWERFSRWAQERRATPLLAFPDVLCSYLASMADEGCALSSIEQALAAINKAHELKGWFPSPTKAPAVRTVMQGIRRSLGHGKRQKEPATAQIIRSALKDLGDSLIEVRDRALLLLGFAGAFRRSELAGLNLEDLSFRPEGVVISLRRSKTDQEGHGLSKAIFFASDPKTCPVRALRTWLEKTGITEGRLFRSVDRHGRMGQRLSDRAIALVVKKRLPEGDFSGHSLRAGFITTAALQGKAERSIMKQTGHRSHRILREYVRTATVFEDNAGNGIL
jgi:integrase